MCVGNNVKSAKSLSWRWDNRGKIVFYQLLYTKKEKRHLREYHCHSSDDSFDTYSKSRGEKRVHWGKKCERSAGKREGGGGTHARVLSSASLFLTRGERIATFRAGFFASCVTLYRLLYVFASPPYGPLSRQHEVFLSTSTVALARVIKAPPSPYKNKASALERRNKPKKKRGEY